MGVKLRVLHQPICLVAFLLSVVLSTPRADASNLQPQIACDRAASAAAKEYGVPEKILKAIALAESGMTIDGRFVAWPWTINVEGRGMRFRSNSEALAFFREQHALGRSNIDLGCFQINHHWHGEKFTSAARILDPVSGARYAAGFLKDLYQEFGNWTDAVGAYHSRNKDLADKYLARFVPIFNRLTSTGQGVQTSQSDDLPNTYPLLKREGEISSPGSLFPMEASVGRGSLFSRRGSG